MFKFLFGTFKRPPDDGKETSCILSVVGESFENDDGTSRQEIIAQLDEGDPIELRPEPKNPYDPNAIAVFSRRGQIGYIGRNDTDLVHMAMKAGRYRGADVDFIGESEVGLEGVRIAVWIASA